MTSRISTTRRRIQNLPLSDQGCLQIGRVKYVSMNRLQVCGHRGQTIIVDTVGRLFDLPELVDTAPHFAQLPRNGKIPGSQRDGISMAVVHDHRFQIGPIFQQQAL